LRAMSLSMSPSMSMLVFRSLSGFGSCSGFRTRPMTMAGLLISMILLVPLTAGAGEEPFLIYHAVSEPGGPSEDRAEGDSPPRDCGWQEGLVETFAGELGPVLVSSQPLWTLERGEILKVRIHEAIPTPGVSRAGAAVFALLEVNEAASSRIEAGRERACGDRLLVRGEGSDLELAPRGAVGSPSVPGGSFPSRRSAERFYRSISDRVVHRTLTEESRAYWRKRNLELVDLAIWLARCDPAYLGSLGGGLYQEILASPDLERRMRDVDCGIDPPDVPSDPWSQGGSLEYRSD